MKNFFQNRPKFGQKLWQEGLTNIQKHAHATSVTLTLQQQGSQLQMELTENGIGYPTAQETTGFGLMSIRQRLDQIHGTVQIINRQQGGTRLLITCPLSLEEPHVGAIVSG